MADLNPEVEKLIDPLCKAAYAAKNDRRPSYGEMVSLLEDLGWTNKASNVEGGFEEDGTISESKRFEISFWYPPEKNGFGYTIEMAYDQARVNLDKEERKQELRAGVSSVHCNLCGEDTRKFFDEGDKRGEYYGLIDANFTTGYLSDDLYDGMSITFSLCEKCLAELFLKFKVPPKVGIYMP
ncbi:MAG: hypothetical protein HC888_13860 [Candidatus Competibacteraceae bacterium]|nr:hypothetical protein [Candidatus Competibacteraceae bacterium]